MGRTNTTNAAAAGIKNISSAAGYSAGDLIYQSSSDNGVIPDNFVSTGQFPVVGNLPSNKNSSVSNTRALFTTVLRDGGSGIGNSAAKLTNGNTVIGYIKPTSTTNPTSTSHPYFVILDDDYNEVVSEVQVIAGVIYDINYNSDYKLNVTALVNGNFVVTWQAGSYNNGQVCSVVFSANGTAVSSVLNQSTYYETSAKRNISVEALPNGNFIVVYFAGNQNTWTRYEYQQDGTFVSQATNIYTGTGGGGELYALGTAVFPDSSHITFFSNGGTIEIFRILSGATSASSTGGWAAGVGNLRALTVSVNSAGEAIVVFNSQVDDKAYAQKFSSTGALIGARLQIDTLNQTTDTGTSNAETGMASMIYSGTDNMLVYGENKRSYTFVLSTSGALSIARDPSYTYYSAGQLGALSLIEYTEGARLFECFRANVGINTQRGQWGGTVARNIDANGFVLASSDQATVGQLSVAVNGYNKANSTPVGASFTAAETKTEIVTLPKTTDAATLSVGIQEVTDYTANGSACHALSNGNVLILAVGNSPYPVTAYVYDFNGNLITSKFIANIVNGNQLAWQPQACNLENGNVVLGLANATGTECDIYILNPDTLETISTRTQGTIYITQGAFRLCSVPSATQDMYAIAYQKNTSQQTWVAIAKQDGTVLQDFDFTAWLSATTTFAMGIACSLRGDIYLCLQRSGQTHYMAKSVRLSETSWSTSTQNLYSFGGSSYRVRGNNILSRSLNGCLHALAKDNSAYTTSHFFDDTTPSGSAPNANVSLFNSTSNYVQTDDFCFTADGIPVTVSFQSGNTTYGYMTWTYSAQKVINTPVSFNSFWQPNSSQPCLSICSPAGNRVFVAYRDNSAGGYLKMFAFEAGDSGFSKTVTAGVDASEKVSLDRKKVALLGVSITDCPVNGTGAVQTAGSAGLNSQYPADTPQSGFDFSQPTADGVKGTINGRNLLLSGE